MAAKRQVPPAERYRRAIVMLLQVLAVALPFCCWPGGYSPYRLPKEVLLRAGAVTLAGLWLGLLISRGQWRADLRRWRGDYLLLGLGVLLLWSLVAWLLAPCPGLASATVSALALGVVLYVVVHDTVLPADVPAIIAAVVWPAAITGGIAVGQAAGWWPGNPEWERTAYAAIGLVGHAADLGTYELLVLPLAIAHALAAPRDTWRQWRRGLAVLLIAAGLLASASAAAIGGAGLGALVAVVAWRRRAGGAGSWRCWVAWGLVVVLVGGVVVALTPFGVKVRGRAAAVARGDLRQVLNYRLELYAAAACLTAAEPWHGQGPGSFRVLAPAAVGNVQAATPKAPPHPWNVMLAAHNEYLQAAAELGLPGLAMVLGLVVLASVRFVHGVLLPPTPPDRLGIDVQRYATAAGVALAGLAVNALAHFVLHLALIAFPAILLLALGENRAVGQPPAAADLSGKRGWWGLLPALLGVVLAAGVLRTLPWNQQVGDARVAFEEAVRSRADPARFAFCVRRSRELLTTALVRYPDDGYSNYLLGAALMYEGRAPEALAALARAEATDRRCDLYFARSQIAGVLLNDPQHARRELAYCLFLKPDFAPGRAELARLYPGRAWARRPPARAPLLVPGRW